MKRKLVLGVIASAALLFSCGHGGIDFRGIYDELTENGTKNTKALFIKENDTCIGFDTNPFDIDNYLNPDAVSLAYSMTRKVGFSEVTWWKMLRTAAVDGIQTEETKHVSATWCYHPDRGLECIFAYLH